MWEILESLETSILKVATAQPENPKKVPGSGVSCGEKLCAFATFLGITRRDWDTLQSIFPETNSPSARPKSNVDYFEIF